MADQHRVLAVVPHDVFLSKNHGALNIENQSSLESSQHLFQPPNYTAGDGYWSNDFLEIVERCPELTWDCAGLLSTVGFGYASGNRTLFREIERQPWLSRTREDGQIELDDAPPHQFFDFSPDQIAQRLLELLENEAEQACRARSDVYVLTSGGLDSRMVAGVMRRLLDQGRVDASVKAVTWGRAGSRDVEIGRAVAEKLNFPWTHLDLGPEHLIENIDADALHLGAMVSPTHLHRMMWFKSLPAETLVIGGSYGDSVGRGEFSGRNVLELLPLNPTNWFGLLKPSVAAAGKSSFDSDAVQFRERLAGRPDFGIRECEYQCHYMRGLIAQTMSVIDQPCKLYQMFTAPSVYGFIWSVHPALRDDRPYERLLELLGNDLEKFPWARTNRPLNARRGIPVKSSCKQYHDYVKWIQTRILPSIQKTELAASLSETGLFEDVAVENLIDIAANSQAPYELLNSTSLITWLLTLQKLVESVPVRPSIPTDEIQPFASAASLKTAPNSRLRQTLRELPFALSTARTVRKWVRRRRALKLYPPVKPDS